MPKFDEYPAQTEPNENDIFIIKSAVTASTKKIKISDTLKAIYPVGSIYINGAINTNPAVLFGFGTWVACGAGRVLVGVGTSDKAFTFNETSGASTHTLTSAQMPSHTHTQSSHTHTQNSHTHTQNSHNHTQNSHNHTQDSHNHTQNQHRHAEGSWGVQGRQPGLPKYNTEWSAGYQFNDYVTNTGYTTPTNNATTATNKSTTATNQSATATNNAVTATNNNTTAVNNSTGGGGSHNNLQPYWVVYMWIRTA